MRCCWLSERLEWSQESLVDSEKENERLSSLDDIEALERDYLRGIDRALIKFRELDVDGSGKLEAGELPRLVEFIWPMLQRGIPKGVRVR